ncbi:PEPxxWA-CTERM sorting domain-containing protein [Pseudoduganella sp. SL102]|uniref:PEPxxWA-CTERM sorting domain-containing protein n=1 Tax=Pseudoduganella sp. SL102 TaxID=2995154 RepID=UPI00248B7E7A|nr:PEPxxWA-CTERM sorting domain-containing protein [Pseudoduganella sp. SL102]WBS00350.1 PEPxxWA-CTERM sorting domain-containing protein [Pseudoduganella sp. SL102]
MKQQHWLSMLLLPAAAACFHTGALAASGFTQTLEFRNLQFGVIDLAPQDGVAAGFTLDSATTLHGLSLSSSAIPSGSQSVREVVQGTGPSAFDTSFLSGQVTTANTGIPGSLALTTAVGRETGGEFSASALVDQTYTLTLAAGSALTLSGELFRSGLLGNPADTGFYTSWSTNISLTSGNTVNRYFMGKDNAALNDSESEAFWYAISNTTDVARSVSLRIFAVNETTGYAWAPSAVPEPATWGMLLSGLGLVAFAARRRA